MFFSHLKTSWGKKEPILSEVTEHKQAIIAVLLGTRFYQLALIYGVKNRGHSRLFTLLNEFMTVQQFVLAERK